MIEATKDNRYRAGTTPVVSPDEGRMFSRRPGRELFPASWLKRKAVVLYDGGDVTGMLLEYCGVGLVVATRDGKTLVSWDCIRIVELQED